MKEESTYTDVEVADEEQRDEPVGQVGVQDEGREYLH